MILESLNQIKDNKNVKSIHIIKLKKGNNVIIGRGKEADVLIEDISVSRKHASICLTDNNELRLEDRGSKFGTLVLIPNEYSISTLKTSLQVGKTLLEVELEPIPKSLDDYNTHEDSHYINNNNNLNNNNSKININNNICNDYDKLQTYNKNEDILDHQYTYNKSTNCIESQQTKEKESKSSEINLVSTNGVNNEINKEELFKDHIKNCKQKLAELEEEEEEEKQKQSKIIEKEKVDDQNRNLNNMHFFAEEEELANNNCYDSKDWENKKSFD